MPFYGTAMSDKKTLEELKRTLRIQICEWRPLGDAKFQPWQPCSVKNCDKAIDKKAEYIWETFCVKGGGK